MKYQNSYTLNIETNRLYFSTSSFKAEKESVLHKGMYNYELSSMMASLFLSGAIYAVTVFYFKASAIHYVMSTLAFIISFIYFRKYIFRERELEAVFDKTAKVVRLCRPGIIWMRNENIPFHRIMSIEVGSKQFPPTNIDGIEFVQKISAQHGTPVPGLGEEKEFVTLLLKLDDGSERIMYAEEINNMNEPSLPIKEIRDFMKN